MPSLTPQRFDCPKCATTARPLVTYHPAHRSGLGNPFQRLACQDFNDNGVRKAKEHLLLACQLCRYEVAIAPVSKDDR